ncbi:hypothetical protein VIGAN_06079200 [Vigna angularis var. angularis]|uniref:Uncharacterized protein n=1 Tax=Vigna angularis var. angularis TaxID=157739 RepID=A0A0S3SAC7_PHAAN|nr:hypothetical protein VIGAN_06079200 [Vigna angularis var. angularis]
MATTTWRLLPCITMLYGAPHSFLLIFAGWLFFIVLDFFNVCSCCYSRQCWYWTVQLLCLLLLSIQLSPLKTFKSNPQTRSGCSCSNSKLLDRDTSSIKFCTSFWRCSFQRGPFSFIPYYVLPRENRGCTCNMVAALCSKYR